MAMYRHIPTQRQTERKLYIYIYNYNIPWSGAATAIWHVQNVLATDKLPPNAPRRASEGTWEKKKREILWRLCVRMCSIGVTVWIACHSSLSLKRSLQVTRKPLRLNSLTTYYLLRNILLFRLSAFVRLSCFAQSRIKKEKNAIFKKQNCFCFV